MLTHEQIMRLTMLDPKTGFIICLSDTDKTQTTVFHLSAVHPEFGNVLAASIFMYKILDAAQMCLTDCANDLENRGEDLNAGELVKMAGTIQVAKQIAVEGLSAFAERVERPKK